MRRNMKYGGDVTVMSGLDVQSSTGRSKKFGSRSSIMFGDRNREPPLMQVFSDLKQQFLNRVKPRDYNKAFDSSGKSTYSAHDLSHHQRFSIAEPSFDDRVVWQPDLSKSRNRKSYSFENPSLLVDFATSQHQLDERNRNVYRGTTVCVQVPPSHKQKTMNNNYGYHQVSSSQTFLKSEQMNYGGTNTRTQHRGLQTGNRLAYPSSYEYHNNFANQEVYEDGKLTRDTYRRINNWLDECQDIEEKVGDMNTLTSLHTGIRGFHQQSAISTNSNAFNQVHNPSNRNPTIYNDSRHRLPFAEPCIIAGLETRSEDFVNAPPPRNTKDYDHMRDRNGTTKTHGKQFTSKSTFSQQEFTVVSKTNPYSSHISNVYSSQMTFEAEDVTYSSYSDWSSDTLSQFESETSSYSTDFTPFEFGIRPVEPNSKQPVSSTCKLRRSHPVSSTSAFVSRAVVDPLQHDNAPTSQGPQSRPVSLGVVTDNSGHKMQNNFNLKGHFQKTFTENSPIPKVTKANDLRKQHISHTTKSSTLHQLNPRDSPGMGHPQETVENTSFLRSATKCSSSSDTASSTAPFRKQLEKVITASPKFGTSNGLVGIYPQTTNPCKEQTGISPRPDFHETLPKSRSRNSSSDKADRCFEYRTSNAVSNRPDQTNSRSVKVSSGSDNVMDQLSKKLGSVKYQSGSLTIRILSNRKSAADIFPGPPDSEASGNCRLDSRKSETTQFLTAPNTSHGDWPSSVSNKSKSSVSREEELAVFEDEEPILHLSTTDEILLKESVSKNTLAEDIVVKATEQAMLDEIGKTGSNGKTSSTDFKIHETRKSKDYCDIPNVLSENLLYKQCATTDEPSVRDEVHDLSWNKEVGEIVDPEIIYRGKEIVDKRNENKITGSFIAYFDKKRETAFYSTKEDEQGSSESDSISQSTGSSERSLDQAGRSSYTGTSESGTSASEEGTDDDASHSRTDSDTKRSTLSVELRRKDQSSDESGRKPRCAIRTLKSNPQKKEALRVTILKGGYTQKKSTFEETLDLDSSNVDGRMSIDQQKEGFDGSQNKCVEGTHAAIEDSQTGSMSNKSPPAGDSVPTTSAGLDPYVEIDTFIERFLVKPPQPFHVNDLNLEESCDIVDRPEHVSDIPSTGRLESEDSSEYRMTPRDFKSPPVINFDTLSRCESNRGRRKHELCSSIWRPRRALMSRILNTPWRCSDDLLIIKNYVNLQNPFAAFSSFEYIAIQTFPLKG